MGGETAEHRGRLVGVEAAGGERRGKDADRAVVRHQQRVPGRKVERGHEPVDQRGAGIDEGTHEPAVPAPVDAQPLGRRVDIAVEERDAAAVERMRERQVGLDPFQAVLRERQRAHGGRRRAERVDRRTHVVHEPGQRERLRACASTDHGPRLRRPAHASLRSRAWPPRPDRSGPAPTTTASNSPSSFSPDSVATVPVRARGRSLLCVRTRSRRLRGRRRGDRPPNTWRAGSPRPRDAWLGYDVSPRCR